MAEIFIYLLLGLFLVFSRLIPKRAPKIHIIGMIALNRNSELMIFVSVKIAVISKTKSIIEPSRAPPKIYFSPVFLDSKNEDKNAEKYSELIEAKSIILSGFNV